MRGVGLHVSGRCVQSVVCLRLLYLACVQLLPLSMSCLTTTPSQVLDSKRRIKA